MCVPKAGTALRQEKAGFTTVPIDRTHKGAQLLIRAYRRQSTVSHENMKGIADYLEYAGATRTVPTEPFDPTQKRIESWRSDLGHYLVFVYTPRAGHRPSPAGWKTIVRRPGEFDPTYCPEEALANVDDVLEKISAVAKTGNWLSDLEKAQETLSVLHGGAWGRCPLVLDAVIRARDTRKMVAAALKLGGYPVR